MLRLALLFAILFLTCFESQATVFRDDQRKVLEDRNAPWGAVGRLYTALGSSCTAFLVYKNIIATNAHCVVNKETKKIAIGNYSFYAGYNGTLKGNDRWIHMAKIIHIWVGTTEHSDSANDWALLKTEWDIGSSIGWFGVRSQTADELTALTKPLYAVSYPSDMDGGEVPYYEKGCRIMDAFYTFLGSGVLHSCSISSGSSGGPLFIRETSDGKSVARVVAIHAAERRNGAGRSVIGVPYSTEYANVAVPSAAFFKKLYEMINESGS